MKIITELNFTHNLALCQYKNCYRSGTIKIFSLTEKLKCRFSCSDHIRHNVLLLIFIEYKEPLYYEMYKKVYSWEEVKELKNKDCFDHNIKCGCCLNKFFKKPSNVYFLIPDYLKLDNGDLNVLCENCFWAMNELRQDLNYYFKKEGICDTKIT